MLRGFLYPCALGDVAPDATPCAQSVCTFGAWAQEGSRRVEGNLIKIKQQPAADVPVCRAVLSTKVIHVSPSRSAATVFYTHTPRDGFRVDGMEKQKEGRRS